MHADKAAKWTLGLRSPGLWETWEGGRAAEICLSMASGGSFRSQAVPHTGLMATDPVSPLLSVPFPPPISSFSVECRDTTRYCEKVKQLKLCQLSQFKSRCCGTCGKAWRQGLGRNAPPGLTEDSRTCLGQNLNFLCFIYLFSLPTCMPSLPSSPPYP